MTTYPGADGTALHFDDNLPGGDTALILLGGGPGRHPTYLSGLTDLFVGHRIIVPHLRSVGDSPIPSEPQLGSFWSQAEDIEALRLNLGLDTITLVAHSAGTRIAMAYAAQFPERLDRMLLITPPGPPLVNVASDAEQIRARRAGDSDFEAALSRLVAGPDLGTDQAMTAWGAAIGPVGYASWGAPEQEHALVGSWSSRAAIDFGSVEAPADFASRLALVTAPVLVVAGADDALTGVAQVVAVADLFKNGASATIQSAGHYPWIERPDEVAEVAMSFLS